MGAVIERIACARSDVGQAGSSVALAASASARVLADAARTPDDVDLLMNVGVYRDGHICEPAMAPLIEHQLRQQTGSPASSGILSFDIANGAGGILNACHAAGALLETRNLRSAMITASDVDVESACDFVLEPRGAALLLRPGGRDEGFQDFHFESFAKHSDLFASRLLWEGKAAGAESGQRLRIHTSDEFLERCVECASRSIVTFLAKQKLRRRDLDLIVVPQFPDEFPALLADRIGLDADRVACGEAGAYTAALAESMAVAHEDGRLDSAKRVLLVTAGAGISIGLALYARP